MLFRRKVSKYAFLNAFVALLENIEKRVCSWLCCFMGCGGDSE